MGIEENESLKEIFREVFPKMNTKYRIVKRGKIHEKLAFEIRKDVNQKKYIDSHLIIFVEHIDNENKFRFDLVKYLNSLHESENYIKEVKYNLNKNKLNKEYIKKIILFNILKIKKW